MKNKMTGFVWVVCFALLSTLCLIQPASAGPRRSVTVTVPCSNDNQCDDGLYCNGREQCAPDDPRADVRGCAPSNSKMYAVPTFEGRRQTHSGSICAGEADSYSRYYCSEDEDRCVSEGEDPDGDGHDSIRTGGDDCDDNDANRYPGNSEICDDNGHDEDCDPTTVGSKDSDGDGYTDIKCYNTDHDGRRNYDTRHH